MLALAQLVFIAMFCCHRRRDIRKPGGSAAGHPHHGERVAERDDKHHADERGAVLDRTYALLRLKRRSEAWANLEAWMRKHCPDTHPFTEYHALLAGDLRLG